MSLIEQNFEIYSGDSKNIIIIVTDDNENIIDLSGSTIKWALKKTVNSIENNIYKDTSNGGIEITDALNGEFTVKLNPSDTEGLIGRFYHEAEVTDAIGSVSTILFGIATIKRSGV